MPVVFGGMRDAHITAHTCMLKGHHVTLLSMLQYKKLSRFHLLTLLHTFTSTFTSIANAREWI